MNNHKVRRIAFEELAYDAFDDNYQFNNELFSGIAYMDLDGKLIEESWFQNGLRCGWTWELVSKHRKWAFNSVHELIENLNDTQSSLGNDLWIGHFWNNQLHGETWLRDSEGKLLEYCLWELGLLIRSVDYRDPAPSIQCFEIGVESHEWKILESNRRRNESSREFPGLPRERGPNCDSSEILNSYFEAYYC